MPEELDGLVHFFEVAAFAEDLILGKIVGRKCVNIDVSFELAVESPDDPLK